VTIRIYIADVQSPLKTDVLFSTDGAQEPECLSITSEENVLTVVNILASETVSIRSGTSTQPGTTFNHDHLGATGG
jgi:hypothetical protein